MPGAAARAQDSATLTVRVLGLTSTQGRLHYALYAEGDEFPGRRTATYRGEVAIDRLEFSITVEGIAPGAYAVILAHDENGNGEIETPWLLNPFAGERVGVSNYSARLYAPPQFEQARFTVRAGTQDLTVTLFPTSLF
jgi:uncharacterized protein (DUF2141 family)